MNEATISSNGVVRPTAVTVDLSRLTDNYRAIQTAVAPAQVMAVLKANAYGHGLVEVARHMVTLGAPYLGVAFLEEGILLREAGVQTPILVMGGLIGNQVPLFLRHDLTITASSVEKLSQINEAAKEMGLQAKIHLKVDTGMERIGVHYYNAAALIEAALACEHCQVEGIYSHFANADAADLSSAQVQLARFREVLAVYERRGLPRPLLCHIANSGAILQLPEARFDMVRAGILLYGVYPSAEAARTVAVRPSLSWTSRVVYFKVVQPDHPVSYGSDWQSDHMVRVVTVPVGYGDGYFRRMSGQAEVIIHGKRYPVVGRVCMDQIMVNIEWDSAHNGDEVILLGESGAAAIRCEDLAEWAGTIPYEVLTNINTRVPRLYVR
ncbi:MAG: alanine racemase [Chloroflexi bacterium]|nr:alanine racemase [Chloroflexota bacterium]MBP7041655.1 alanine racemase [Chloroflexota bacterium]